MPFLSVPTITTTSTVSVTNLSGGSLEASILSDGQWVSINRIEEQAKKAAILREKKLKELTSLRERYSREGFEVMRLMYQGVPARQAAYMLNACLRPMQRLVAKNGRSLGTRMTYQIYDPFPQFAYNHGYLMRVRSWQEGKRYRKGGFMTTKAGLELLDRWSARNEKFGRFFAAYVDKKTRDNCIIRQVDARIEDAGGSMLDAGRDDVNVFRAP